MTVDTQKLHELARAARLFSDMPGSLPPLTVKAHINGLSDCVESACTEIDAQAAEIERLRERLQGAANYIDTLGGVSKEYRAFLSGEPNAYT